VEAAPEGQRNHALNVAAFNMGSLIAAGAVDEVTVVDYLTVAARSAGLDESEIAPTIRSGLLGADAKTGPRVAAERTGARRRVIAPAAAESGSDFFPHSVTGHSSAWGELPPVDGAEWMFSAEDPHAIVWGVDDDILWAEGEALMIAGGMGLGKTTLAGMLIRGQLGLDDTVLGLPIARADQPILYLAMDRPRQIRRSMRRQFDNTERDKITGKLLVRTGPPIADMAVDPTLLMRMAVDAGAGTVYVDSLKDAVVGLSEDATAAAYNRARQALLTRDVQICELHHNRKSNPANGPGGGINEVFGSTWLTSGAGSVIQLTGDPGDLVIRFAHVKTPADEVGPWHLHYDPSAGRMDVVRFDYVKAVANAGPNGLTAEDAARALYERRPSDSECKKAARQLNKLVKRGQLSQVDGAKGISWFLRGGGEAECISMGGRSARDRPHNDSERASSLF
jgi:replicative DNA helicase